MRAPVALPRPPPPPLRAAPRRPLRPLPRPPSAAVKQTFGSFDEMIQESTVPVLVDFYAPWCGPCQLMHTTVESVSSELGDAVAVVRINTDRYKDLASRFAVRALPTLVLFVDGAPVDRVEGAVGAAALAERVRYYSARLDKKFGRR